MKRFVRSVCIVLAAVLLLTASAYAAEEITPYGSIFFISHRTYLEETASDEFEVWFDVVARSTMDELGVSSIKVQRSLDGENWATMKTYTPEDYPQMICENTGFHGGSVTYSGIRTYYYRAYVTFYAKNSTGIGKTFSYTQEIQLGV